MISKRVHPCAALLAGLLAFSVSAQPSAPKKIVYSLSLSALADGTGTDVTITVQALAGQPLPSVAQQILLKATGWTRTFTRVSLSQGQCTMRFSDLPDGSALSAQVLVKAPDATATQVLRANTVVVAPPDLRIADVLLPDQIREGDVVALPVIIEEIGGSLGATFDLMLEGELIETVVVSGLQVNPSGSVEVLFNPVFAQAGTFDLTLSILNVSPADADSSNNTYTRSVTVEPSGTPTSYYFAQYTRNEGTESRTTIGVNGPRTYSTDGRWELFSLTGMSDLPMSWPIDFSVRMYADNQTVIEADRTGMMPTSSYQEGEALVELSSEWVPEFGATLTVVTRTSPSGGTAEFSAVRYSADYVWVLDSNGNVETGLEQFGVFVNASSSILYYGIATSALGAMGGWTQTIPIFEARIDEELPNHSAHYTTWQAFASDWFQE